MRLRTTLSVALATVSAAAAVLIASPANASIASVGHVSTTAGNFCKSDLDTELNLLLIGDGSGGSWVEGHLCRDHVTTGVYWTIFVEDTAPDGKCAHATALWYHHNGNFYSDWGMYVCGYNVTRIFWTPVRDWTKYYYTTIGAFVDNGQIIYDPSYYWF